MNTETNAVTHKQTNKQTNTDWTLITINLWFVPVSTQLFEGKCVRFASPFFFFYIMQHIRKYDHKRRNLIHKDTTAVQEI